MKQITRLKMVKMGPFSVRFLTERDEKLSTSGTLKSDEKLSHFILQILNGRLTIPQNEMFFYPKTNGMVFREFPNWLYRLYIIQDTRYKKLYLKSTFEFTTGKHLPFGYFVDKHEKYNTVQVHIISTSITVKSEISQNLHTCNVLKLVERDGFTKII